MKCHTEIGSRFNRRINAPDGPAIQHRMAHFYRGECNVPYLAPSSDPTTSGPATAGATCRHLTRRLVQHTRNSHTQFCSRFMVMEARRYLL